MQDLCEKLKPRYDALITNVPISSKKRMLAEIDIVAYKDGFCDIYEVKCSHRITKARKQLRRIRRLFSERYTIRNSFFFCGESGMIVTV